MPSGTGDLLFLRRLYNYSKWTMTVIFVGHFQGSFIIDTTKLRSRLFSVICVIQFPVKCVATGNCAINVELLDCVIFERCFFPDEKTQAEFCSPSSSHFFLDRTKLPSALGRCSSSKMSEIQSILLRLPPDVDDRMKISFSFFCGFRFGYFSPVSS